MTDIDPIKQRAGAFNRESGGGVSVARAGAATISPSRQRCTDCTVQAGGRRQADARLYYWSWQGRWKDVGDMSGIVLPLDEDLDQIASTEIFWTWTWGKMCKVELTLTDRKGC